MMFWAFGRSMDWTDEWVATLPSDLDQACWVAEFEPGVLAAPLEPWRAMVEACGAPVRTWKGAPPAPLCVEFWENYIWSARQLDPSMADPLAIQAPTVWDAEGRRIAEEVLVLVEDCRGPGPYPAITRPLPPDARAVLEAWHAQSLQPTADWVRPSLPCPSREGVGMPPPAAAPRGPVSVGGCACAFDIADPETAYDLATYVVDVRAEVESADTTVVHVLRDVKGNFAGRRRVLTDPYVGTECALDAVHHDGATLTLFLDAEAGRRDQVVVVSACTVAVRGDLAVEPRPAWEDTDQLWHRRAYEDVLAQGLRHATTELVEEYERLSYLECGRLSGIPVTPSMYRPLPVSPPEWSAEQLRLRDDDPRVYGESCPRVPEDCIPPRLPGPPFPRPGIGD
jgi:hypothetical protein